MKKLIRYLRQEAGTMSVEWVAVGAIVVALIFAAYNGVLDPAVQGVITNIATAIQGLNP
jgi:Flp pilus assembly pilin Flp